MESLRERVEHAFVDADARSDQVAELFNGAATEFDALVLLLQAHHRAVKVALLEIATDIEELPGR